MSNRGKETTGEDRRTPRWTEVLTPDDIDSMLDELAAAARVSVREERLSAFVSALAAWEESVRLLGDPGSRVRLRVTSSGSVRQIERERTDLRAFFDEVSGDSDAWWVHIARDRFDEAHRFPLYIREEVQRLRGGEKLDVGAEWSKIERRIAHAAKPTYGRLLGTAEALGLDIHDIADHLLALADKENDNATRNAIRDEVNAWLAEWERRRAGVERERPERKG